MTDDELDRLQALADEATKGPWSSKQYQDPEGEVFNYVAPIMCGYSMTYADAAFIAAARDAVPALIAEVRRLRLITQGVQYDRWIRWEDRIPIKGEAGYVVFRDDLNGRLWIQEGTTVTGEWWHYQPLAWLPRPALPFWTEGAKS